MPREYLSIGPCPPDEACAQVGALNFHDRSQRECQQYIQLLRRTFGPEPDGSRLAIKWFPHDFGQYPEVVCYYSTDEGEQYAMKCEADGPMNWDELCREKLK